MLAKRLIPIFLFILIAKERSEKKYDYWLCGGAIVSPRHIITAAACLLETSYLYAIAGYVTYVDNHQLELDECTRTRKQRIVKICTPQNYTFEYNSTSVWTNIDIGIALVEKPYNFSDLTYRLHCSYTPAPIEINYDPRYQVEGTHAIVFGWGHRKKMRKPHELLNQNSQELREASVLVTNKTHCKRRFVDQGMAEVIDKFMICCDERGNIKSNGEMLHIGDITRTSCQKMNLRQLAKCDDDDEAILKNYDEPNETAYDNYDLYEDRRRLGSISEENVTAVLRDGAEREKLQTTQKASPRVINRRQGICQNDHGGPLVNWNGDTQILIGVASTSLYNNNYECVSPNLFTSTSCNSMFIQCVIGSQDSITRKCSDMMKDAGYYIKETNVDW